MTEIPHEPGSLISRNKRQLELKNVTPLNNQQSTLDVRIAGKNHRNGKVLVKYPGSTVSIQGNLADTTNDIYRNQNTLTTRGAVGGSQRSIGVNPTKPQRSRLVINKSGEGNESNEVSFSFSQGFIDSEECNSSTNIDIDPSEPPSIPPNNDNGNDGGDPGLPDDFFNPDFGDDFDLGNNNDNDDNNEQTYDPGLDPCANPVDNCEWYSGLTCPPGMSNHGFIETTPGVFKVLCCSETPPPPGDGCDWQDPPLGWACVDNQCQLVPGGVYASQAECQASGCEVSSTWDCENGECIERTDGSGAYST